MDTYTIDEAIYKLEVYCDVTLSENQSHRISQVMFDYGRSIFEYALTETLNRDYDKQFENSEHLTNYFCKIAKGKFNGGNKDGR